MHERNSSSGHAIVRKLTSPSSSTSLICPWSENSTTAPMSTSNSPFPPKSNHT